MAGAKNAAAAGAVTPAASRNTAADLVALVALEPVRHNGQDFAPGAPFWADAASAEALLASGAATLAD